VLVSLSPEHSTDKKQLVTRYYRADEHHYECPPLLIEQKQHYIADSKVLMGTEGFNFDHLHRVGIRLSWHRYAGKNHTWSKL